jgi:hypothetical protein
MSWWYRARGVPVSILGALPIQYISVSYSQVLTGSYATTTVIPRITDTELNTLATKRVGVAYSPVPNFDITNLNNCK